MPPGRSGSTSQCGATVRAASSKEGNEREVTMGLFGPTWTEQTNRADRDRKANERARQIRARKVRADNRRHMIEHPVRHGLSKVFGG